MPEMSERLNSTRSPAPVRPDQPLRTPITVSPAANAERATARIAAFSPGASPPPVRIPTLTPAAPSAAHTGVAEKRGLLSLAEDHHDSTPRGGCRRGRRGRDAGHGRRGGWSRGDPRPG